MKSSKSFLQLVNILMVFDGNIGLIAGQPQVEANEDTCVAVPAQGYLQSLGI